MEHNEIASIARMLHRARKVVVFTGAGISTESGIPDFRSPGGIWSRYNADDLTYQKFRSSEHYRRIYWKYDRERYPAMRDAAPNEAHHAIVEIEKAGKLSALVTQNIDGLHAKAGNSREKILELHGTVHEVVCVDCGMRWPREEITDFMDREGVDVPYCDQCDGPLKCATIAFGQTLPQEILAQSFAMAGQCDVLITVGSSLVVQPANMLPLEASRKGAKLALINMTPTVYDSIMDVIALGSAGAIMSSVMKEFRQLTQSSSG
ncbi:MAG: NAD-dependent deacetylase [Thermodesulfobacteriota bacterium]|nr:NAD-dependent deacetylase [Thermodesulfobacteriota bacterium]